MMYIFRICSSWKTGGLLKFNETSLCSATRGTGRIRRQLQQQSIDISSEPAAGGLLL